MKAIILAAGRGSRLGQLTQDKPKPLTQLMGKPLVEWQILAMQQAGIEHVTIINGYNGHHLAPFGDNHIHNPNWHNSNMVRTLLCADELLSSEPMIVSYGDIVYRSDIIRTLINTTTSLTTTYDIDWQRLWTERFSDPLSDAETFQHQNGQLVQIGDTAKSIDDINGQYMGLIKFTPESWQAVKQYLTTLSTQAVNKLDMTSLLANLLRQGIKINVTPISGGWVEVDNPSDIALYESSIKDNDWHHDWRTTLI